MANNLKEHNFFDFDATVVAKSKNTFGNIITTMVVTMPRYVLAEFNTHRMFSRNSASSRAIPFRKMVERVKENPFVPIAWQYDHKGMQGNEYIADEVEISAAHHTWLFARDEAVKFAEILNIEGEVTKQLCNRLLEPFMWHTVIVTSTNYENFFKLRCPQYGGTHERLGDVLYRSRKDAINAMKKVGVNTSIIEMSTTLEWLKVNKSQADIHISLAAEAMWDTYNSAEPKQLEEEEYHIPFIDEIDEIKVDDYIVNNIKKYITEEQVRDLYVKISIATCARISYGNIDPANSNIEADLKLYNQLTINGHASPLEHVAKAMSEYEQNMYIKGKAEHDLDGSFVFESNSHGWCDNFKGFVSQRHLLNL